MSNDPAINSALLRLCATTQSETPHEGGRNNVAFEACNTDNSSRPSQAALTGVLERRQAGDYDWLRSALASVESPERQVKRLLETIEKTDINKDDMLEALDLLNELVEDLNWATEFTLMQGPERILKLLRCLCTVYNNNNYQNNNQSIDSPDVRISNLVMNEENHSRAVVGNSDGSNQRNCADTLHTTFNSNCSNEFEANLVVNSAEVRASLVMIIGHASQLHKPVQDAFALVHWEQILPLMLREERVAFVTAAVVFSISALCRQHEQNTLTFAREGGLAILAEILKKPATMHSTTLLIRTFRLISFFAECGLSTESAIRSICEFVECRLGEVADSNDMELVRQSAARTLLTLINKSPATVKDAILQYMPTQISLWMSSYQQLNEREGDHENNAISTTNASDEDMNNNSCLLLARQMLKLQ